MRNYDAFAILGMVFFDLVIGGPGGLIGAGIGGRIHKTHGTWIGAIMGGFVSLLVPAILVIQV